ncbi:MAG: hypothetical protein OXN44_12630 [Acidimicrobiaceae bacterium]|nr:hypothetical protein [Acidimicrobiaceae bacterium]
MRPDIEETASGGVLSAVRSAATTGGPKRVVIGTTPAHHGPDPAEGFGSRLFSGSSQAGEVLELAQRSEWNNQTPAVSRVRRQSA